MICEAGGQTPTGFVTVLWHFYTRVVKFCTIHYGDTSVGGTRCSLHPHNRLILLACALHLTVQGLHPTTKRNMVGCTVSNMFLLASYLVQQPNRAQSMMAECTIAHLRAFQKDPQNKWPSSYIVRCSCKLIAIVES
jgi:hypothetical protein